MIEFIENLDNQELNELDSEIDNDSVREEPNDALNQDQLNQLPSPTQSNAASGLPFVLDFTLTVLKSEPNS